MMMRWCLGLLGFAFVGNMRVVIKEVLAKQMVRGRMMMMMMVLLISGDGNYFWFREA
jgi:hypothetical protein